jgi:hypothetical protein
MPEHLVAFIITIVFLAVVILWVPLQCMTERAIKFISIRGAKR